MTMIVVLIALCVAILVLSILALRASLAAFDEAKVAREVAEQIERHLRQTMQVNAYFHAKTWALQKGEPEPPRPDLE